MSNTSWTDRIVGERMAVDQEFSSQIASSRFSNQQWSLIMTATEFEIEHPDDPDRAQIVADTDKLEQIIPELENVQSGMGAMAGAGGSGAGGSGGSGSGGLVDSIKGALGMGGGGANDHAEKREAAERLTQTYADELQSHLESKGRWESVREAAVVTSEDDTETNS
ncbi:DUF5799 family protein [Natrialba aegyptia]|uniref:Uncharacterized protein n=1 Tax=Natrialba aegyptia DSM 13077 TaxID=1227491 RepID=M0B188_9EURY|nr:DUF5799 family protein [Natrialba aegyptia]ELZ04322.1 hypothetical protein C480_12446 [Natrialba aegyptia DSM 13077]